MATLLLFLSSCAAPSAATSSAITKRVDPSVEESLARLETQLLISLWVHLEKEKKYLFREFEITDDISKKEATLIFIDRIKQEQQAVSDQLLSNN